MRAPTSFVPVVPPSPATALTPLLAALLALIPFVRAEAAARIDLDDVDAAGETFGDADLRHYRWLLDDEQREIYEHGDAAARRELMRVVWASLDPTPTTPENERKEEHFRRLGYAFARFPLPVPPWWDGRGELLIRYGPPDTRVESIGGRNAPNRESWVYQDLQLAFELEDEMLADHFSLAVRSSLRHVRFDQEHFETPIEAGVPFIPATGLPRGVPLESYKVELRTEEYQRMLDRGAQVLDRYPQLYVYDSGGDWLPVAFDAVGFRGDDPGVTRLEIHTGLRARDLLYQRREGLWGATVTVDAVAKTKDYREAARAHRISRDRQVSLDGAEDRLVLDGVDLDLPPGTYELGLAVRDTTSRRAGAFRRTVEVPAFPEGQLAISGIQTALDVGDAVAGDRFRKGPLKVTPWPLREFPKGRDVHLYFEIYGLERSPAGDTLFRVDLRLEPREAEKRGWFGFGRRKARPAVSTSWGGRGNGDVAREHFALDTGVLDPGTYDLRLVVTDRIGKGSAERATSITIGE